MNTQERDRNQKVLTDKDIFESNFGRETQLWSILVEKFIMSEKVFHTLMVLCRFLPHSHITRRVLQDEDIAFFQQQRWCISAELADSDLKRKTNAKSYSRQRQPRLNDCFGQMKDVCNSSGDKRLQDIAKGAGKAYAREITNGVV